MSSHGEPVIDLLDRAIGRIEPVDPVVAADVDLPDEVAAGIEGHVSAPLADRAVERELGRRSPAVVNWASMRSSGSESQTTPV